MAKISFEDIKFICNYCCNVKEKDFTVEEIYNEIKNDVKVTFYQLKNVCTVMRAFLRKDNKKIEFYKNATNNGYGYIYKCVKKSLKDEEIKEPKKIESVSKNIDDIYTNLLCEILSELKKLNKSLGE